MKKATDAKKKLAEKQVKVQEKAKNKTKTQILEMMKLATTNRREEEIRTFKNILSDLVDGNESLDDTMPTCGPILIIIPLLEKSKQANSIR